MNSLGRRNGGRGIKLLLLILMVLSAGGLFYLGKVGPPVVLVKNESPWELSNIRISGASWGKALSNLPPGATGVVIPDFTGESGLSLEFQASGRLYSKQPDVYLEGSGGYTVKIVVDRDLQLKASWDSLSWNWRRLF